jgi:hypothetical protein
LETREKISKSKVGNKNPSWKGKCAGYVALHIWVRRRLGRLLIVPKTKNHRAKRYEWANISGEYKRDLEDWHQLCPSCNRTDGVKKHKRFLK